MENIIKQIRKIKGVMTIEKAGENMAVVVLEPIPQKIAVRCTNQKQFEFVWINTNDSELKLNGTEYGSKCICDDGYYNTIDLERNGGMQDLDWFKSAGYKVITFGRYLDNYNLRNEWVDYSKPKSLSPDELVDGKIYVDEDEDYPNVFRFKKPVVKFAKYASYSRLFSSDECFEVGMYSIAPKGIRPATPSEAQSLIRAEIEHGYFHELRDAK